MNLLWIIGGGLAYRIRGGLLDDIIKRELPNLFNRSVWAIFIAIFIATHAAEPWKPFIALPLAFVGVLFGYFGAQFDLSQKKNLNWKNLSLLTLRGMFIILPVAVILQDWFLWRGVLAGALFVPCYLLGNVLKRICFYQAHTQWGEFLLAAVITGAML